MNWNNLNNRVSAAILEGGRLQDLLTELDCDIVEELPGGDRYRGRARSTAGMAKTFN